MRLKRFKIRDRGKMTNERKNGDQGAAKNERKWECTSSGCRLEK